MQTPQWCKVKATCEGRIRNSNHVCICIINDCDIRECLKYALSTVTEDSLLFNTF